MNSRPPEHILNESTSEAVINGFLAMNTVWPSLSEDYISILPKIAKVMEKGNTPPEDIYQVLIYVSYHLGQITCHKKYN